MSKKSTFTLGTSAQHCFLLRQRGWDRNTGAVAILACRKLWGSAGIEMSPKKVATDSGNTYTNSTDEKSLAPILH